jgi:hypothetical protein
MIWTSSSARIGGATRGGEITARHELKHIVRLPAEGPDEGSGRSRFDWRWEIT